jgi:hypothetical protein
MADKKFFEKFGYVVCDTAPPYFELLVKQMKKDAPLPRFRDAPRHPLCPDNGGISVYYTPQCPYNDYYVNVAEAEVAKRHHLPFVAHPVTTQEEARNAPTAFPLHSVFYKGALVTHEFLYDDRSFDRVLKPVINQEK